VFLLKALQLRHLTNSIDILNKWLEDKNLTTLICIQPLIKNEAL